MANWSFRDALEELEVKGHFDELMLRSNVGLRLGDIRFAEMQTTLRMCAVYYSLFIRYIDQGCFNADKLPIDGCRPCLFQKKKKEEASYPLLA